MRSRGPRRWLGIHAPTGSDTVFYVVDLVVLVGVVLLVVYPLMFVVSSSLSDPAAVLSGEVRLLPVRPSLEGYRAVLHYRDVWTGFANTLFYTGVGTIVNVAMTLILSYPLSRRDFVGRRVLMFLFTFTMFFQGGLIPTYLLVRDLGLIDTRAAMILPGAIGVWNVIIMRTYLATNVPAELYEAARLDGASNIRMLWAVVLPLCGPIVAVCSLFYAVNHWNQFFDALIYLRRSSLRPLQIVLREILILNSTAAVDEMVSSLSAADVESMRRRELVQGLVQYALIVVSTLPLVVAYPFVQRYFVRGALIGAVKG